MAELRCLCFCTLFDSTAEDQKNQCKILSLLLILNIVINNTNVKFEVNLINSFDTMRGTNIWRLLAYIQGWTSGRVNHVWVLLPFDGISCQC